MLFLFWANPVEVLVMVHSVGVIPFFFFGVGDFGTIFVIHRVNYFSGVDLSPCSICKSCK